MREESGWSMWPNSLLRWDRIVGSPSPLLPKRLACKYHKCRAAPLDGDRAELLVSRLTGQVRSCTHMSGYGVYQDPHVFPGLLLEPFPPRQRSDEDNQLSGVRRGCGLPAAIRCNDAPLNYLPRREFHHGQPRVIRRARLAYHVTSNDPDGICVLHDWMGNSKVSAALRMVLSIHFCFFVSEIKPCEAVVVRRNRHRLNSLGTYPCIHTRVGNGLSTFGIHKFDFNCLCTKNRAG